MKKLQRFGIVSLAALTLGAFVLSNEQIVKAEANNTSETSVSDNQPAEAVDESRINESIEEDTVYEAADSDDSGVSDEAEATADDRPETISDGEVEEKPVSFDIVEHRFVVGDSAYDVSTVSPSGELVINKGETLSVSNFIQQRDGWEASNVEFHAKRDYSFEKMDDLTLDGKVSYDRLASENHPKLVIIYKPKSLAPNSPSSSVIGEGENVLKYVSTKHYLVTDEGIALLGDDTTVLRLSSQYESGNMSYQPNYRPFDNLEPIGATIFKDASRIEPFRVGDTLNHNDTTLKNQTYVHLYYKKTGHTLEANPYDLPQVEVKLRQFEVFYVDENGRNILNASEVRSLFDKVGFKSGWKKLELSPNVALAIPIPDLKGYKARNTEMVVAYDDLSDEKVNTIRVVYDTISDDGKKPLTLQVSAWTGDRFPIFGADSRGISYNIEVKPGETVTLKPEEIEGYTPWQKDGVTITYDQLSRYFGNGYRFFYSKNSKDIPELSKMTEMLRVVHVLDDGSAPLNELVEKSTMEEVLILKYGDAPVVPTFKKIEGWQPDDMRSYVDASHIGGWTGKHGIEKGYAYQYGIETDDWRIVLVYKKADSKVEEPKEPDASVDTKPIQPTDTDSSTPTDNTTGNTGTVDAGSQGEGSDNSSETTSQGISNQTRFIWYQSRRTTDGYPLDEFTKIPVNPGESYTLVVKDFPGYVYTGSSELSYVLNGNIIDGSKKSIVIPYESINQGPVEDEEHGVVYILGATLEYIPAENTNSPDTTIKPEQPKNPNQDPSDNNNANTDGGQTDASANGSKTTPVTPPADNNGENQTNPTETPSTDTTVDNGGTSDVGVDTNVTDSTKTEEPVDNTGNVGKEDGKTAEVSSPSDSSVNHTGTSDTGEETNTTVPITSVNSDTILSPETSADATDNEDSEVIFPIVVLDDKTDTSTSSEAAKTLVSQKGERQDSLVKKQTLSRVESRHLPKTNDGHNVLSALGLAILMTLGLYRPNKRKA